MALGTFGSSLAPMVPMTYSLALRVDELAPRRAELLGYVTGAAQFVYLILSPLIGLWSDRTRSRLGRRTPFMACGAALGIVAMLAIACAPSVLLVGLGWVVGMTGWSMAGQAVQNVQADRVPEDQRGRVAALTGIAAQVAPAVGIGITYAVSSSVVLMFMVPGVLGAVLLLALPFFRPEGDSRMLVRGGAAEALTVRGLVASYGFSTRSYPDFA
ncbi:MFS transporter [Streptomyces sp. NPDC005463]|uniref:MFS transporter n=1 Tax=Streptomyces sp. NPDC005463 TaxID=3154465 RepID=UPI00339F5413